MMTKTEHTEYGLIRIDKSDLSSSFKHSPNIKKPIVGFVFYLSGNGEIHIRGSDKKISLKKEPMQSSSFFVDPASCDVQQLYHTSQQLHKITILISRSYLKSLFPDSFDDKRDSFYNLIHPNRSYIGNDSVHLNGETLRSLRDLTDNSYQGQIRSIWMQGKILELISSHKQQLEGYTRENSGISKSETEKIREAEKIISCNYLDPPSLDGLARATNLNTFKLKKGFKRIYGKPVFGYLRDKRLNKAHQLLEKGEVNITQAAYSVGYNSLGSFSNAFMDHFGYRPSDVTGKIPLE
jgi:AraC family transcriptional regulator, transcriptional activator of the genes for pyochelin and ferripyochelin receptors